MPTHGDAGLGLIRSPDRSSSSSTPAWSRSNRSAPAAMLRSTPSWSTFTKPGNRRIL